MLDVTDSFADGDIVLTYDNHFARIWLARALPDQTWLVILQFSNGELQEYHSDLLSPPPKPRLAVSNGRILAESDKMIHPLLGITGGSVFAHDQEA